MNLSIFKLRHRIIKAVLIKSTNHKERAVLDVAYSNGTREQFFIHRPLYYANQMALKMPLMLKCSYKENKEIHRILIYINMYGNSYPTAHLNNKFSKF